MQECMLPISGLTGRPAQSTERQVVTADPMVLIQAAGEKAAVKIGVGFAAVSSVSCARAEVVQPHRTNERTVFKTCVTRGVLTVDRVTVAFEVAKAGIRHVRAAQA